MENGSITMIFQRNKGQSRRLLTAAVTTVLALAMMTSVAFAHPAGHPSGKDGAILSNVSSAPCACRSISEGVNPSMDLALWYSLVEDNSIANASRALRADANPSMDVALWYAGPETSFVSASRALRADANPSMDVALWYAGPETSFVSASRALRADANPSMDVALWYSPAEVGPRDLLCSAEDLSLPCP